MVDRYLWCWKKISAIFVLDARGQSFEGKRCGKSPHEEGRLFFCFFCDGTFFAVDPFGIFCSFSGDILWMCIRILPSSSTICASLISSLARSTAPRTTTRKKENLVLLVLLNETVLQTSDGSFCFCYCKQVFCVHRSLHWTSPVVMVFGGEREREKTLSNTFLSSVALVVVSLYHQVSM